jgi:hypothetical protein
MLPLPAGARYEPSLGTDALTSSLSSQLIKASDILWKNLIKPTTFPTTICSYPMNFSSPWVLDPSSMDDTGGITHFPLAPRRLPP